MSSSSTPSSRRFLFRWLFWFALCNTAFLSLLSLGFRAVAHLESTALGNTFFAVMTVGHFASLSIIALLPILILIAVFNRRRAVCTIAVGGMSLLSALLLLDIAVYRQYRSHLNRAIFELMFGDAAREIFVFSTVVYLQAAVFFIGVVILQICFSWTASRLGRRPQPLLEGGLFAALAIFIISHHAAYATADMLSYTPITKQAGLFPGYFPLTARKLLGRLGLESTRSSDELRISAEDSTLQYPLAKLSCSDGKRSPNVLFLVIDSWVYYALSSTITPNISRLASKSSVFTDHYSGGSATRSGIFSLLYGIPATYWHAVLAEQRGPVLMDVLKSRNYEFGIFASAALTSPEFDRTAFSTVPNLRLRSDGATTYERDLDITQDFKSFLNTRDEQRPFFGFLFYDAPHSYAIPEKSALPFNPTLSEVDYFALNNSTDPTPLRNLYLNSVYFVDQMIGSILDELSSRNLLDSTIVVVTGDHGQEFNDNKLNYWGHNGNFSRFQTGVPLVISWPGKSPREYSYRTSHFDIVPTLLSDLFACSNSTSDYSVGQNLFSSGGRNTLLLSNYGQYAIVEPDRITVMQPWGDLDIVDLNYQPINDASVRQDTLRAAIELQSRFFER